MNRRLNGEGTVYLEADPRRKTTHRAHMQVRLPDGTIQRIVARGYSKTDALQRVHVKARRAMEVLPDSDRLTLAEYLDRWLEHKTGQVRASTIAAYRNDVRHVKQHLGRTAIGKLRAYDLQVMLQRVRSSRDGMDTQSEKVRRTVKQALRQAVRWELIPRSPAENLEPLQYARRDRNVWGPTQIRAFLEAVRASQRPVYYPLFVAALFTGARSGELLALKWGDVAEDHITIRRTWSRHVESQEQPPKTKASYRIIPISRFVRDALGARGEDDELVFQGRWGQRPRPENIRRALLAYAKDAGVPPLRFHELRRTYATTLARLGHHPRVIQKLLGHSTPHLAMTVYTDVLQEQEHAARLEPEAVMNGASFGADPSNISLSGDAHSDGSITSENADGDDASAVRDAPPE